jgi:hypothetical protein
MKSRVFQWFMRKENIKEFTLNAEKQAKTMGTVGSMETHNQLYSKDLRQ